MNIIGAQIHVPLTGCRGCVPGGKILLFSGDLRASLGARTAPDTAAGTRVQISTCLSGQARALQSSLFGGSLPGMSEFGWRVARGRPPWILGYAGVEAAEASGRPPAGEHGEYIHTLLRRFCILRTHLKVFSQGGCFASMP
jgi:hypothetical protein